MDSCCLLVDMVRYRGVGVVKCILLNICLIITTHLLYVLRYQYNFIVKNVNTSCSI